MRAAPPADAFNPATSVFQPPQRLVVKHERIDPHQHLLALQELHHAIGHRWSNAGRRGDRRRIGRREAGVAVRALDRGPRAILFGRQLDTVAGQRHALARRRCAGCARSASTRSNTAGVAAAEQLLAQLFAREPSDSGCAR